MNGTILVTDSLFIDVNQIKQLEAAGYEVERLDKPNASEEELCEAIKGKIGYILGGVEHVTPKVIEAADSLRAIAFTGTDWKEHIPAWQEATNKNIAISNTPFTNSQSVAEWMLAASLAMERRLFQLGRTGEETFVTTPGFDELHIGIVGLGHVGTKLAEMYTGVGIKKVSYWNRSPKNSTYNKLELNDLLAQADIICFCVSAEAGKGYVDADKLKLMKDGAILTVAREMTLNEAALLQELQHGRLRAFLDYTPSTPGYLDLDLGTLYCSNMKTSYNSSQANKATSDMATQSLLNLLAGNDDKYRVN